MAGFDKDGLYHADRFFADDGEEFGGVNGGGRDVDLVEAKKTFRRFIREFHQGGFNYVYRDELRRRYLEGVGEVEVNVTDLSALDEELSEKLQKKPGLYLPAFEEAASEVGDELTRPRPEGAKRLNVQVLLRWDNRPQTIRSLASAQVSTLVKVSGIVIAASGVRCKAASVTLQCRACRHTRADLPIKPGLEGFPLPRQCGADQSGQAAKCPLDPYFIVPDRCACVDFQTLKLQENPEDVPHGELPRHLQLYVQNQLTDVMAPGNRVTLVGVYSIRKTSQGGGRNKGGGKERPGLVGIRAPYLRVLGVHIETSGPGRTWMGARYTPAEEEQFRRLADTPNIYEKVAASIAPSIFGSEDIKKAIACLLFGGSRKRMPDGLRRRGDINVLLLGDPGTAKSQLLKFVEQAAPIGVYTSGKGSSAAGLTASVIRDPASKNFIMEGGAMVLGDGGVVCIDEFDKMREDDRVAIHEAMEQQTISIAKAGITTTLNSRCSVLAAANSVYGRWDDTKGEDNMDFMPTILSRFDMIFIVKDEHNEARDKTLARHVIALHAGGSSNGETQESNGEELSLETLKRFVDYARNHCGPRLAPAAANKLVHHYVRLRNPHRADEHRGMKGGEGAIPITVRQLEAVIRMSEALAKMELRPFAGESHVQEALRLFQVSTVAAASSGSLAGAEGFTTAEDQEAMSRVERQLKKRFAIGTQVAEHTILQDFLRQGYQDHIVRKVIMFMLRRGDVQHRMQKKMLFRIK